MWTGWATRDEAQEQTITALAAGGARPTAVDPQLRTVRDLLEAYLKAQQARTDLSPSTVQAQIRCARRITGSSERSLPPLPIASVLVSRLRGPALVLTQDLLAQRYAPATVSRSLQVVCAAWRWARERGFVPDRALDPVRPLRPRAVYSRYTPSPGEVIAILGYLQRWPWAQRAVRLLWATGARRGEIASLTWDQIDLVGGRIELRGKTGTRTVPLHPTVIAELATWPRERELVTGASEATIRGTLALRIRTACEALGLPPWSPHGLRRAAVGRLYRAHVEVGAAAALLGHSPEVALRHYRQVADEDLREAVCASGLGVVPAGEVIQLSERSRSGAADAGASG